MKKIIITILAFLFSLSIVFSQFEPWVPIKLDNPYNYGDVGVINVINGYVFMGSGHGLYVIPKDEAYAGGNWLMVHFSQNNTDEVGVNVVVGNENIICVGSYEGLYISRDFMQTWEQYLTGLEVYSIVVKDNMIFAGTDGDGLYVSTDNGVSWTQRGLQNLTVYSLDIIGNNIFAATATMTGDDDNPIVDAYLSTDYGTNWKHLDLSSSIIYNFRNMGNDIYVACFENGIYKSTDNGGTWETVNSPAPLVFSLAITGNNIFAGTNDGVFLSTDYGENWRYLGLKTPYSMDDYLVYCLVIDGEDIFAADGGAFRAKISDLITDVKDNAPTSDISIYPNPASEYIIINSNPIEQSGGVLEYTILNLLGQNVQSDVLTDSKIDISKLPPGVFCIVFSNAGKQIIKKFIKY